MGICFAIFNYVIVCLVQGSRILVSLEDNASIVMHGDALIGGM